MVPKSPIFMFERQEPQRNLYGNYQQRPGMILHRGPLLKFICQMVCMSEYNLQDQLPCEGVHPLPDYLLLSQGVRLALNSSNKQVQDKTPGQ